MESEHWSYPLMEHGLRGGWYESTLGYSTIEEWWERSVQEPYWAVHVLETLRYPNISALRLIAVRIIKNIPLSVNEAMFPYAQWPDVLAKSLSIAEDYALGFAREQDLTDACECAWHFIEEHFGEREDRRTWPAIVAESIAWCTYLDSRYVWEAVRMCTHNAVCMSAEPAQVMGIIRQHITAEEVAAALNDWTAFHHRKETPC